MSATSVNDGFIQLTAQKEPYLYSKLKDTQFLVVKLNTGGYTLFYSTGLFSVTQQGKLLSLLEESIQQESRK